MRRVAPLLTISNSVCPAHCSRSEAISRRSVRSLTKQDGYIVLKKKMYEQYKKYWSIVVSAAAAVVASTAAAMPLPPRTANANNL